MALPLSPVASSPVRALSPARRQQLTSTMRHKFRGSSEISPARASRARDGDDDDDTRRLKRVVVEFRSHSTRATTRARDTVTICASRRAVERANWRHSHARVSPRTNAASHERARTNARANVSTPRASASATLTGARSRA